MSKLLITLSFLFIAYCSFAQSKVPETKMRECCACKYPEEQWYSLDINILGAEYHRLKRKKCEACNSWLSDYGGVMKVLGNKLNGKTEQQVIKIMGKPEAMEDGNYIYFWRGGHDYLYFNFPQGKAISQWYYALD
jgi:hypothetical protein